MSVLTAEQSELRTQLAQRWAHFYHDPEVPLTALSEEEIRHSYEVADEFLPMFDALREQIATAERRGRLEEAKWTMVQLPLPQWAKDWLNKRIAKLEAAGPEGRNVESK